jgi:hypothetical protein
MLGTERTLRKAVQMALSNANTRTLLMLNLGSKIYTCAIDEKNLPHCIVIDALFSESVRHFHFAAGGVTEDYMPMLIKHVELLEEFYTPYSGKVDLNAVS